MYKRQTVARLSKTVGKRSESIEIRKLLFISVITETENLPHSTQFGSPYTCVPRPNLLDDNFTGKGESRLSKVESESIHLSTDAMFPMFAIRAHCIKTCSRQDMILW